MALLSNNTTIGGKNPLLYTTVSNTSVNLNTYYDEGSYKFNNLTSATNFPSSFTWIGSANQSYLQVIKIDNNKSNTVIQIIYKENSHNTFIRYCNAGTWSSWEKIWNAGNDGSGSGLDADLLDNVQGSGYIRDYGKTYSNFNSLNRSGFYQLSSASNSPDGSGGLWGCIVFQTDSGNNISSWLCQIAIKDNATGKQLYTRKNNGGTWTSWEKIWTGNIDGSGSGLDADMLDGKHASEFLITNSNTYYINSQSDFDTMIASSTWGGKTNVVFNCSVVANYKDVVIPTSVRYINGNGNTIDRVKSFGYANEGYNEIRRIENLTSMNSYENGSLSPDVEDYRIEFTGFKNCSNLYNCRAIARPCQHKDDLSNIRRGFSKCYNLHNCIVKPALPGTGWYAVGNENILFDSCKYLYNCYGDLGAYGDAIYCNCQYIYESTAIFGLDSYISSGGFYNCKDLYNCNADKLVKTSNVFVNCTNLNGCYYNFDVLYKSVFINCTNLINCSVTTNSTNQPSHYINCTNLIDCIGTKDTTSELTSTSTDKIVYVSHDLLTAIKNNDGYGSGIDADLLDGRQAYTFANYGIASTSLATNSLTQTTSGTSSLYRFQDTNNTIGEGTNIYYGIIQIYYSASYYTRLAISMASGKVYRQTNGASSWNEISVNANPTIPVVTTDPTTIENGQLWIRSDL